MAQKPPLGLSVNLTDPAGNGVTWRSDSARPGDRPQGINFRTIRGNGFGDASCTLIRDARLDSFDLGLFNDAAFIADDGTIAYEGRLNAFPRSFDQTGSSITPTFAGNMAKAQDRPFTEVYVDRLFGSWSDASVNDKATLVLAGWDLANVQWSAASDGLTVPIPNGISFTKSRGRIWYVAPTGVTIGKVSYQGSSTTPAPFSSPNLILSSDDVQSVAESYASTLDSIVRTITPTTARPYALWDLAYTGAATAAAAGASEQISKIAVYGNHGLAPYVAPSGMGALYLSDVLIDIAQRFCPGLNTDGVQFNGTLIEQCRYDESLPYDAFLDLNKYALWELGVWEGKTLHYAPADLTDYDWEVRLSDPGVTTSLQGDDASNLYNGVRVTFTDAADGKTKILSPDDYPDLADDAVENPANEHGLIRWFPWSLSSPCTIDMALNTGRAKLAELNQPKEAGTVSLTGHVRDRAGHWQPVHAMRAGDTLAITDFPNARPRLIVETDYSHDGYSINVGVDNTLTTIEGFLDRYGTALTAAGIA